MISIISRIVAGLFAAIVVLIVFAWFVLLRPVAQPHTNDPLQVFDHGSIGNEAQQGLPYWIWRVLPTVFADHLPGPGGYASVGFLWEPGRDHSDAPIGFSRARVGFERSGSFGKRKATLSPRLPILVGNILIT